jgi:membrane protease YdiL (CAAX protease family)
MDGLLERFSPIFTADQLEEFKREIADSPIHPFWTALLQGLIVGPTVNAIAGFGEEVGWRGLMFRELIHTGFWRCSALTGFVWGLWHAPLVMLGHNYPQHPSIGVLMMIAWTMLLSPIFSYVRLKSGAVPAAAILHGSLNATAGLSIMLVKGGDDLTTGVSGLPGFAVLGTSCMLLYIRLRDGWCHEIYDYR